MNPQAAIGYWLVVPAAGGGQRIGGDVPKQYLKLAGRTLIEWALAPFLDDTRCKGIVVALAPDDDRFAALSLSRVARLTAVQGGLQRGDSVRLALEALPAAAAHDWVLVHDAARPCVSVVEIDALLMSASPDEVGAVLVVPVADTLKRSDGDHISQTEDRAALWRALTPQMFRVALLRSALDQASKAGRVPTDESQAVEWLGHRPRLVRGNVRNIKVTEPGDLALAEFVLSHGVAS